MSTSASSRVTPRSNGASAGEREAPVRVAAIDVGSNSIRQIIADVSPDGAIRVIDEMKAAPRLAAGLGESGALDPEVMDRAIEAITRMHALAKSQDASRIEAIATSAVREAANGEDFIER